MIIFIQVKELFSPLNIPFNCKDIGIKSLTAYAGCLCPIGYLGFNIDLSTKKKFVKSASITFWDFET